MSILPIVTFKIYTYIDTIFVSINSFPTSHFYIKGNTVAEEDLVEAIDSAIPCKQIQLLTLNFTDDLPAECAIRLINMVLSDRVKKLKSCSVSVMKTLCNTKIGNIAVNLCDSSFVLEKHSTNIPTDNLYGLYGWKIVGDICYVNNTTSPSYTNGLVQDLIDEIHMNTSIKTISVRTSMDSIEIGNLFKLVESKLVDKFVFMCDQTDGLNIKDEILPAGLEIKYNNGQKFDPAVLSNEKWIGSLCVTRIV